MKTFYQWLNEAEDPAKSEEEAFHRAIMASPQDALPWLVYADWLEERNHWRGPVARAIGHLIQQPSEQTLGYVQQALAAGGTASAAGELDRHKRVAIIEHLVMQFRPYFGAVLQKIPALIALVHPNLTVEELEAFLPTGSGLNGDWDVDEEDDHFVARNSYSVTNSNADRVGYVDFDVIIPKHNPLGFQVNLDQGDIDAINARYEQPEEEEDEESEDDDGDGYGGWGDDGADDAPYMDDLGEIIHQEVQHGIVACLQQTGEE